MSIQIEEAGMDRPLRADALRNRERLLICAEQAFAQRGSDTSMEEIARDAEVGIGTLYRHFPTRDALVEAVYRRSVEDLCDAAERLRIEEEPGRSLRLWLQQFVDHAAVKRGMAVALKSALGSDCGLFEHVHARITAAVNGLVGVGVEAGAVRGDVDGMELLRAVSGITSAAEEPGGRERAHRMVDLLMDGMESRVTTPVLVGP
jgi:AcrR family transcriptional regulator